VAGSGRMDTVEASGRLRGRLVERVLFVQVVGMVLTAFRLHALPAFPGAEGFGSTTGGGRGGAVIAVTTLDNSGAGSLREALKASGPRIVVFRVGGIIDLDRDIVISNPFVTIAGQTAPGGGICLRGAGIPVKTHDVIMRGMRIRAGDGSRGQDYENRDCIGVGTGSGNVHNVIVDHCSVSWSVDEAVSTWFDDCHDITFQYCIISEALYDSHHSKGVHSRGFLVGDHTRNISIHHNLFAHNNRRNPEWKGDTRGEFINNVVYNWGKAGTHFASEDQSMSPNYVNIINNYYKPGPDSYEENAIWFYTNNWAINSSSRVYISGNVNGLMNGEEQYRVNEPATTPWGVTTSEAGDAYREVPANAGALLPRRDEVDERIVASVDNGTGGIIDSPSEVGGYPDYASGTPPADGDGDGMPDSWEEARGLNPDAADDDGDRDGDGYTNIEEYINGLFEAESEPPDVTFTRPTETASVEPADLGVVVEATDIDGAIDNVKLYIDDRFVREERQTPYEWGTANTNMRDSLLLGLTAGAYTLRAVATDNQGAEGADTMTVTVEAGVVGFSSVKLAPGRARRAGGARVFDLKGKSVLAGTLSGESVGNYGASVFPARGVFVVVPAFPSGSSYRRMICICDQD